MGRDYWCEAFDESLRLHCLQQSGGYSGYPGVEYASMEGEGREREDAPEAEQAAGASPAGRRPEAEVAMPASPSARRGQLGASSPARWRPCPATLYILGYCLVH